MKKTGFIAILGRPNVGKSTILNALLGEKISIVSSKPQTTRNRITGIFTQNENQYVFIDTPGMHKARNKLDKFMVNSIINTIKDVDIAVLVVEANAHVTETELNIIENIKQRKTPAILVINKTDLVNAPDIAETIVKYKDLYDFNAVVPVSALKNKGISTIINELEPLLQESVWFFDEDALTDQPDRQFAAEIIREKILRLLDKEIPHGIAVVIEEFKESKKLIRIRAEIYCERESHKKILIGNEGSMLKTIGSYARQDMESFFGVQVYLDLWVKVKEKWRDDDFYVNNFGYKDSEK
jgi:GTP-binding protein Era